MRPAPARAHTGWPDGIDLDPVRDENGRIGLAVSGGGDSTALAVLLTEALPGRDFVILTVDHGLRAESGEDAARVAALGRRLGLTVVTLAARSRPKGSIQAWARRERHALFREAAATYGLSAITTGHTLDDQAETLLLRLARGSGLRGLSAMRPRAVVEGLAVLRPLLSVRREDLRSALRLRGIGWVEDPSNADPRFDRTAIRRLLPFLVAAGLTPERLAATARHLARASEAIDEAADALVATAARRDRAGAVTVDRSAFRAAPHEVRLRALAALVHRTGGAAHPPRFAALAPAEAALSGEDEVTTTLARTVLSARGAVARIWREARNLPPLALGPGECGVFDGRYVVRTRPDAPPVTVAAIGAEAARALPVAAFRPAVATAPGIFAGERLVAAPTLGVRLREWPAGAAVLSHVR